MVLRERLSSSDLLPLTCGVCWFYIEKRCLSWVFLLPFLFPTLSIATRAVSARPSTAEQQHRGRPPSAPGPPGPTGRPPPIDPGIGTGTNLTDHGSKIFADISFQMTSRTLFFRWHYNHHGHHWHHWHRSGSNLTNPGGDAVILSKLVADAEKNCYIAYGEILCLFLGHLIYSAIPRVKFWNHNSSRLWGRG